MENKIFAYMRISTNHKTQKTDRQQQVIIEYSVKNQFKIDEFISDVITGGTKADKLKSTIDKKQLKRDINDTLKNMSMKQIKVVDNSSVKLQAQKGYNTVKNTFSKVIPVNFEIRKVSKPTHKLFKQKY